MYETFRSVVRFRKFEFDPVARRLRTAMTVEDLRTIARRRLPRGVFDYIDGGAEDERTMARNADGFARLEFRPNVLRDVSHVDTGTTILGMLPLVIGGGAGAELYQGLGASIVGGLLVSTLFTLVLIPAVYLVIEDLREGSAR